MAVESVPSDLGLETLSATRFGSIPTLLLKLDRTQTLELHQSKERPLRLVYHGALHRDTTYIERLCELLYELKGAVTGFTPTTTPRAFRPCVDIHPRCLTTDLPELLAQFDLGLIIYRGLIRIINSINPTNCGNTSDASCPCSCPQIWMKAFPLKFQDVSPHLTFNARHVKISFKPLKNFLAPPRGRQSQAVRISPKGHPQAISLSCRKHPPAWQRIL